MPAPAVTKPGPIARVGYPFIIAPLAVALVAAALDWPLAALAAVVAALFFAYFFRDPERTPPADPQAIVAPADGKVILVDQVTDEDMGPARRVAIFMNVFDVHVNRVPMAGTVAGAQHYAGRFLAAYREDAATANERQVTVLEGEANRRLKVVQIAGLLARRIIAFVKPGDSLARGQRLGLICFGSRVDVYLPENCEIIARKGDRLKAGVSVVARWQ